MPARAQAFVFDAAVNHGPDRALRFVQQVCNAAGFGPVAVDGKCGPHTSRAAAEAGRVMGDWFLAALVEEREERGRRRVEEERRHRAAHAGRGELHERHPRAARAQARETAPGAADRRHDRLWAGRRPRHDRGREEAQEAASAAQPGDEGGAVVVVGRIAQLHRD